MSREEKLIKNILVALDGSQYSEKVAKYAADIAQKYSAQITLIHVIEPPTIIMPTGGAETSMPAAEIQLTETITQQMETKAKKLLTRHQKNLQNRGINAKTLILKGNIPETILTTAEKNNHDLIIVGSRGLGNIKRFLLGSTSDKISKHAHCPVLIVR
ncbi:MAG: universal stress protein [Candidatus Freyrarchaeum guaymaensis]